MIDIKGITKSFGPLQVLKGIDLHIGKGEIVSIVGPSGAGKTTLLQIIGTLDRPDSGSVAIDGIDTSTLGGSKLADFRNRHVGFVFQFHQLLPEFTAKENIMIPAYIAGTQSKEAERRAAELLDFMGLADRGSPEAGRTLGRREAKGGRGTRSDEQPRRDTGRRTFRKPRQQEQGRAAPALLRPARQVRTDFRHRHTRRAPGFHYRQDNKNERRDACRRQRQRRRGAWHPDDTNTTEQ